MAEVQDSQIRIRNGRIPCYCHRMQKRFAEFSPAHVCRSAKVQAREPGNTIPHLFDQIRKMERDVE